MTAVAVFQIAECPIVFGDLLLTGPTLAERQIEVPALGDVTNFFGDSGWAIQGLAQKVTIVSPECALAWSGSWLGARIGIAGLRRLAEQEPLRLDCVRTFLATDPETTSHDTSFVGWVAEKDHFGKFLLNASKFEVGQFGTVYCSGSGVDAIEAVFTDLAGVQWDMPNIPVAPSQLATMRSLTVGGMLLRAEFHGGDSASTLRSMFGGGYEIASFVDGRFQKIGNVTFLVWEAVVDESSVRLSLPRLIVSHKYVGDILYIQSARLSGFSASDLRIVDRQQHFVQPMFEVDFSRSILDQEGPLIDSPWLCHCIYVRSKTTTALYTQVQYSSDPLMMLEEATGGLKLGIKGKLITELQQILYTGMRGH